MTKRPVQNITASIHQRLLNASLQSKRTFNDLVTYYAIERFLYRLSNSAIANQVVLKGGLMLHVWNVPITRVTRDIDLLGKLSNEPGNIKNAIRGVCSVVTPEDGLVFDLKSISTQPIAEDADYAGVRATFRGHFGQMSLAMQIDFGFSDIVTPSPTLISYPTILGHPRPQLMAYNRETVIAEKLEAMVKLGELNTRMKDFFDIWALAQNHAFNGLHLADAIRTTFDRRKTQFELQPACFCQRFAAEPAKAAQWRGFLKNSRVIGAPPDFSQVIAQAQLFLQPILAALMAQKPFNVQWPPKGPWR